MPQMLAAICTQPGKIVIEDVSIPVPEENQVLIEVKAVGVCRSDVTGYMGKHPLIPLPMIMGHECSGKIAALGPGVKRIKVGDEVAVETFFRLCGECAGCRNGRYNTCKNPMIIGHNVPGAFAQYMLANANFIFPKPSEVSFEEAALTEPLSVGVHAIKIAGIQVGERVVILGAGAIGLFALQVAKLAGGEVTVVDVVPSKLELARKLGADHIIDASQLDVQEEVRRITGGDGAEVVIEAVGKPATLQQSVDLTQPGGRIVLIGFTGNPVDEINLSKVTLQEMKVMGILGFCRDYPTSLNLLSRRKISVTPLISSSYGLQGVEKAIQQMIKKPGEVVRIIIHPQDLK